MARSRGYIRGTAAQLGVDLPSYQAGASSGGLLVLLVGAYLLLAFVTGRLGWLTRTIEDTFGAYERNSAPPPQASPPAAPSYGPMPAPQLPPAQAAWYAAYYNRQRPRTAGALA